MRRKQQRGAVRFAARAMERATKGLPSDLRDRYYDEMVAEMHGLGRVASWRYAAGVFASGPSMRSALTDGGPVPVAAPRRPLSCRTNVHHRWKTFSADDGGLYRACGKCGKEYVNTGTAGVIVQ